MIAYRSEVQNLIDTLHATLPDKIGTQEYTSEYVINIHNFITLLLLMLFSPHSNLLVGRDGAATSDACTQLYSKSWGVLKVRLLF